MQSLRSKLIKNACRNFTFSSARFIHRNYTAPSIIQKRKSFKPYINNDERIKSIMPTLKKDGIVFIENFYSPEEIDQLASELIPQIDQLDQERDSASTEEVKWLDRERTRMVKSSYGYSRILNIEGLGEVTKKHCDSEFFRQVASEYYGLECKKYQTVVQKSVHVENGPGLDWHYDHNEPRFKAFLYLHDVNINHGPFSLYKGSQRLSYFKLKKMQDMYTKDYANSSIVTPLEISNNIEPYYEKVDAIAKKGTLVFADVNAIHRGLMTQKGFNRYAVVVYFAPK